jgi:nucleoside-diphosphate-sugar epimerase
MKLFVTGGTGFIGSHFLQQALAAGHDVIAQRRPGSVARLPLLQEPVWVDRNLDQDFTDLLCDCDAVVHLASHTPNPPYAPLHECLYWNVFATTQLFQQAAKLGVRDFLVAGTCFEYGEAARGQEYVHPATEMRPSLSYPVSKATATIATLGLARSLGLRLQVLRIFQVFGEGEAQTRFWPSLRAAAFEGRDFEMSSGVQVRDFIEASEVAERFLSALDFSSVETGRPQVRNIGTGKGQSLYDFAVSWWSVWGARGRLVRGKRALRPGELPRLVANINDTHIT